MTLMSDEEFYNYVTTPDFGREEGINLETLRECELIHYEEKTLPENTRFRNNLFAWLKQTRILAVNRKMFDPYQSHSYRQEELGSRNPLIHPTMRFPSYYRLFPGFPAYNSNPGGNGQQQNQQDLDTMNEAMLPQFLIRNPDQFIGQSLYQMLSSITAYNSYKSIISAAIRDIPYTERELREQAEYSRISDREPEFIARNQSNPNRHAGILEEWNIDDILDLLSYYLNDSGSGQNDTYRKLVVSSEYLWTGSVTTRQVDSRYLQLDDHLLEDITGYDFSEHLDENYDNRDDDQQDYGEWLDMQRENFDWGDVVSEYPVAASYTGLVNLLWNHYGPDAERYAEIRRISGTPHAFHNQKIKTTRKQPSALRYGLLYHNPTSPQLQTQGELYRPSLPEDNDRYNDMLHNTEYTYNSVMWTNYYLARDSHTYLIIEDQEDELITELSSTQGFTFAIPVNFLNFLRYPPTTLKKTIF